MSEAATTSATSRLLAWFKGEEPGAEPQQAKRRRHRPNHKSSGSDDASNHGKVRFQSNPPQTKTIISLNHYTEEEFNATFWTQPEFLKIYERADSLLEQIEAGKMDPKKVCVRGLEKMMGDLRKHVKKARQDTVDAVMDTQEQQWQAGRDDDDEIRKASFRITQHSQQRALELARQDFLTSRRYLKDLIDQTTGDAGQRMPLGYSFNPRTDTISSMPLASILKKPKKSSTRSRGRRSQSPKRTPTRTSKSPLRLKFFGGKDTSDSSSPSTATTAASSTDSEPRSGSAFESARRTMERVFPSMVTTPTSSSGKPLTPPPLVRQTSNSSASSSYSERSLRKNSTPKRSTSECLTPSKVHKNVGTLNHPARHSSPLSKSDRTDGARSSRDAAMSRRNMGEHSDGPRARPAPQSRRPPGRSASEHVCSSHMVGPPSKQQLLQQKQRMQRQPPARSASEQVPRGDRPTVPASGRRLNSDTGALNGSTRGSSRPSSRPISSMDRSKSPKRAPPRRTASEHGPPRRQPSSSQSRKDLIQQSLSQQQQQQQQALALPQPPSSSTRKIRRQTSQSEHTHGTAPLSDDSFLGLDSFHGEEEVVNNSTRSMRSRHKKSSGSNSNSNSGRPCSTTLLAHDGQVVENIRGTMTLTLE